MGWKNAMPNGPGPNIFGFPILRTHLFAPLLQFIFYIFFIFVYLSRS